MRTHMYTHFVTVICIDINHVVCVYVYIYIYIHIDTHVHIHMFVSLHAV